MPRRRAGWEACESALAYLKGVMPDKPLPEWRVGFRPQLESKPYDLKAVNQAGKRLELQLLILGALLFALAVTVFAVAQVLRELGYR